MWWWKVVGNDSFSDGWKGLSCVLRVERHGKVRLEMTQHGQAMPTRLQPLIQFVDWGKSHSREVFEQIVGQVESILAVIEQRQLVQYGPMVCPDYWSLYQSATVLKQMAEGAGCVEAATFFAETQTEALDAIVAIDAVLSEAAASSAALS